jgi:hypothetical protein
MISVSTGGEGRAVSYRYCTHATIVDLDWLPNLARFLSGCCLGTISLESRNGDRGKKKLVVSRECSLFGVQHRELWECMALLVPKGSVIGAQKVSYFFEGSTA